MTEVNPALLLGASCAILAGLFGLTFELVRKRPARRPVLGNRGLKRAQALRRPGLFTLVEPALRYLAARLSGLWPGFLLPRVGRALTESGDHLGLSEDELIAASALSAIGCGALWLAVCMLTDLPVTSVAAAFLLGAFLPWFRLRAVAQDRAKSVTRSLPGVIELAAMCMGAGLDFPSSLRRVVESAAQPEEPIVEELQRVLQELDLGCTRRSAMHGLAARVPSDEVRELVNSVLQAEDKGSPLARVLTIQAQTLRLRRSVAAEEMASEAALMLVGPMTLIFLCVIVLLLAPVAVRVMTGGLGSP
jgi:tight adherence protein C